MDELRDRYVRFDWAIKRLLRQKANFGVLEGFLTVFLGEEIHIREILESESNQEDRNDKYNRVDIKALNSKGEIVIIEIQNTRESYYLQRILYGAAKAVTEHVSLGDTYAQVRKVYSISILYFDLGKGADYLYHGQTQFIGVHTHDRLQVSMKERNAFVTRTPSTIFPEYIIIRVNEFNKVARSPLEEWMKYLKDGIISADTTTPGLQEARRKLQYYTMSDKERQAYDEHINNVMIENDQVETAKNEGRAEGEAIGHKKGLMEGHKKGLDEGRAEGRAEERLEMARKMKAAGMSIETIQSITGLSAQEIVF